MLFQHYFFILIKIYLIVKGFLISYIFKFVIYCDCLTPKLINFSENDSAVILIKYHDLDLNYFLIQESKTSSDDSYK